MTTSSTLETVRRRWSNERPFAGHTKESLQRKIASGALRPDIREQLERELLWRARHELA
jgi:hypothetical protein